MHGARWFLRVGVHGHRPDRDGAPRPGPDVRAIPGGRYDLPSDRRRTGRPDVPIPLRHDVHSMYVREGPSGADGRRSAVRYVVVAAADTIAAQRPAAATRGAASAPARGHALT